LSAGRDFFRFGPMMIWSGKTGVGSEAVKKRERLAIGVAC
jgi:hypothetical protein